MDLQIGKLLKILVNDVVYKVSFNFCHVRYLQNSSRNDCLTARRRRALQACQTRHSRHSRTRRKAMDLDNLEEELGKELADLVHYAFAIAAINNLDLNEIILSKDKKASIKYNRDTNLEDFVLEKRA